MLEGTVVTALGIRKDEKKLGYAVSTVNSESLMATASPTLGTALYGKAAGVRVTTAPGGATGAISINVRGLSTITGTNQPLWTMIQHTTRFSGQRKFSKNVSIYIGRGWALKCPSSCFILVIFLFLCIREYGINLIQYTNESQFLFINTSRHRFTGGHDRLLKDSGLPRWS